MNFFFLVAQLVSTHNEMCILKKTIYVKNPLTKVFHVRIL